MVHTSVMNNSILYFFVWTETLMYFALGTSKPEYQNPAESGSSFRTNSVENWKTKETLKHLLAFNVTWKSSQISHTPTSLVDGVFLDSSHSITNYGHTIPKLQQLGANTTSNWDAKFC